MTSTRSNPRLAQSGVALTSLGAVGGARGTAAGALRVFVEFLTTYDRKALSQLESDLANVDHAQNNAAIAEEKRLKRLSTVRTQLAEADRVIRGKLNTELRSDLKQIEALENSRSRANKNSAAQQRVIFNATAKSLGLSQAEIDLLSKRSGLRKEEVKLVARQEQSEENQTKRLKQQSVIQGQLAKVEAGRAAFLPKLGGLAVGAVGGILGGAILGVGFSLAQTALEKVGDVIQDLVDPSRHARDAMLELGQAVNDVADQKKISQLQAASEIVARFGLGGTPLGGQLTDVLSQAAAQQKVIAGLEREKQVLDLLKNSKGVEADLRNKVKDAVIAEAQANGTLTTSYHKLGTGKMGEVGITTQLINGRSLEAAVTDRLNSLLGINTDETLRNAAALQAQQDAALLAAFAQEQLASAIQRAVDVQGAGIDSKIDALSNAGPSAKTKGLQAAIDKASGGGGGNSAQLRNIAEERELILLRQRLRLLGTNIDLEKFSGKFLLEAIDAKINALQKEGQAQDHLNQLLDLRFKMSQKIQRQEGESIQDFQERRAQEQRHQLQEQAQLERDDLIQRLQDRKDKVEDEVKLEELAEQKRDAIRQAGLSAHLKALQKALAASQKADADALAAKRKALEAEKKAYADKARNAAALSSVEANEEIKQAVRAANTIEKLAALSGKTRGLIAAREFLRALVDSGVLLPGEAANVNAAIARISSTLNSLSEKSEALRRTTISKPGQGPIAFAKGGVIPLSNARNPFGNNFRFGEEGDEIGVILSNRVSQALSKQKGGVEQVGPFNLYGSRDPLRDRYELGRTVREAMSEALG